VSSMPHCKSCNSELKGISFSVGIVYVCCNWQCQLYRQSQGVITSDPPKAIPKRPKRSKREFPGYQRYLARRNKTYQRLRDLGVPANLASHYRGFSSCALLEAKIKAEGGVTEEVISWAKDRRKDIRAERKARAMEMAGEE